MPLKRRFTQLNEGSRLDFKFGPFMPSNEMHLVVLLDEVIRMYHLLSLEEVHVESGLVGHQEEELHLEGLQVEKDKGNLGPSPREFLQQLFVRAVDIVVRETTSRTLVGKS